MCASAFLAYKKRVVRADFKHSEKIYPDRRPAKTNLQPPGFRILRTRILNQPYCFDIELVINCHYLDLDDYLHKPAYLCFDDQLGYGVHGVIHEFVQGETRLNMTHYHLKLVPTLFYLNHRTNQRIFQQLTVKEIIAQILKEHSILTDRYRFEIVGAFEPREYCTQYKESDLHFIQRLCEEEGIHFHFEHGPNHHTVVFFQMSIEASSTFPKPSPSPRTAA